VTKTKIELWALGKEIERESREREREGWKKEKE
jgi:hypothetical protein